MFISHSSPFLPPFTFPSPYSQWAWGEEWDRREAPGCKLILFFFLDLLKFQNQSNALLCCRFRKVILCEHFEFRTITKTRNNYLGPLRARVPKFMQMSLWWKENSYSKAGFNSSNFTNSYQDSDSMNSFVPVPHTTGAALLLKEWHWRREKKKIHKISKQTL